MKADGCQITPEDVIKSIIWIESKGYHTKNGKVLVNPWGFTGFMQLGEHFGDGRYDPARNISLGAKYLNNECLRSATTGVLSNSGDSDADYRPQLYAGGR